MKNCLKKQKMCSLGLVIKKKIIEYTKLDFRRDRCLEFSFSDYRSLEELFKAISFRNLSIDKTERIQDEYEAPLAALEKYRPRNSDYGKKKNKAFEQCEKVL